MGLFAQVGIFVGVGGEGEAWGGDEAFLVVGDCVERADEVGLSFFESFDDETDRVGVSWSAFAGFPARDNHLRRA
nr:MAG TPA: hypothetical protein [Caudoviricetes sp.]